LKQSLLQGFAVVTLLAGVIFGSLAIYFARAEQRLSVWPTTPGIIESIAVVSEFQQRSGSSAQHKYWVVEVSYTYTVDGVQRIGRRLSNAPPQESLNLHSQASTKLTQYAQRYPVGKNVAVHYDPEKPDKAFLEIELGHARVFGLIAVISMILCVALFVSRNFSVVSK
jgi:hypothetical protein